MLVNDGFRAWSHLTPGRPACLLAQTPLPPAPATPRGSTGHAWSAGFDWAAVVVVTGRRRRSGRTVPGAARSPPSYPVPSLPLVPPAGWSSAPTAPPMASAPVRRGWGAPPRSRCRRAALAPGGRWRQASAAGSRAARPGGWGEAGASTSPSPLPGPSPGRTPGAPPGVPELRTEPGQPHGPQNSRRVPVERLRQNHLAGLKKPRSRGPASLRGLRARCRGPGTRIPMSRPGGPAGTPDSGKRPGRRGRVPRGRRALGLAASGSERALA